MAKKNIQSVEPNIADLANSWLKSYKLDYKLEQESLNDEIDKALEDYSQIKVFYQDERYTSFEAEEYLKEAGLKWEDRKKLLDKVSAQIILQNYLDENK